ncbi:hypothetical protein C8039_04905 [Halogeometricum sp. wsp3]|nr:hypothetical protein C8039_04905 [Halogeometricum sp. wsp3]
MVDEFDSMTEQTSDGSTERLRGGRRTDGGHAGVDIDVDQLSDQAENLSELLSTSSLAVSGGTGHATAATGDTAPVTDGSGQPERN